MRIGTLLVTVVVCGLSGLVSQASEEPSTGVLLDGFQNTVAFEKNLGQTGARLGHLPLFFEENRGQHGDRVLFSASSENCRVFFSATEVDIALPFPAPLKHPDLAFAPRVYHPVRMQLVEADEQAQVTGIDRLETRVNYYRGRDPEGWITDVPRYQRLRVEEAWPGIDVIYRGVHALEYDFVLRPGADPTRIALRFDVVESLSIDRTGTLCLEVNGITLRHAPPTIYQEIHGQRTEVTGRFRRVDDRTVGFTIDGYNASHALVIDPQIRFSTYLGGSGQDHLLGLEVDSNGDIFVCGASDTADFTGAIHPYAGGFDAFVFKIAGDGSAITWVTYIGGQERVEDPNSPGQLFFDEDAAYNVAIDSSGNVIVAGSTTTKDMPTTTNAFDSTLGGFFDAFVARLDSDGNLDYCSYLGGDLNDGAFDVAVGSDDHVYLTGSSDEGFPTTSGAIPRVVSANQDVFVTRMDLDAATVAVQLVYSTQLGGDSGDRAFDIEVDADGSAHVAGRSTVRKGGAINYPITENAFKSRAHGCLGAGVFSKVACDPSLTASENLQYSTFMTDAGLGSAFAVAVGPGGLSYVTGRAPPSAVDYTTDGAFQENAPGSSNVYFAIFDTAVSGTAGLEYASWLGSSGQERPEVIRVTADGTVIILGSSIRTDLDILNQRGKKPPVIDFPTTDADALVPTSPADWDIFIVQIDPSGNGADDLLYGTLIGGTESDTAQAGNVIAVGADLDVVVGSITYSAGLATTDAIDETLDGDFDGLLTVITIPGPAFGTVTGTVTEDDGVTAIAAATVALDTGESAITAANGTYTILDAPVGDHTVTASAAGFDTASQVVTVTDGLTSTANFSLDEATAGGGNTLDCIVYTTSGGPGGDRNLKITLQIVDGACAAANGASVEADVTDPDGTVTSHSGTTNSSGEFVISFNRGASGIWSTDVTTIDDTAFTGTPVHSFDKGLDASGAQFCTSSCP